MVHPAVHPAGVPPALGRLLVHLLPLLLPLQLLHEHPRLPLLLLQEGQRVPAGQKINKGVIICYVPNVKENRSLYSQSRNK